MKKCLAIICVLMFLLLEGCGFDISDGKRPNEYPNTEWISSEPYMVLKIDEDGNDTTEMKIDGEIQEVKMGFRSGYGVDIIPTDPDDTTVYLKGKCEFSSEKCVITITDNSQGVIDDSIKKITLARKDVEKKDSDIS